MLQNETDIGDFSPLDERTLAARPYAILCLFGT